MKQFMIKYRRENASEEQWHRDIARFIAALDSDPAVKGKISYRCLKNLKGTDYYHLATAADDAAIQALQSQEFFRHYNEQTRLAAAGGEVVVFPLETVAETQYRP